MDEVSITNHAPDKAKYSFNTFRVEYISKLYRHVLIFLTAKMPKLCIYIYKCTNNVGIYTNNSSLVPVLYLALGHTKRNGFL